MIYSHRTHQAKVTIKTHLKIYVYRCINYRRIYASMSEFDRICETRRLARVYRVLHSAYKMNRSYFYLVQIVPQFVADSGHESRDCLQLVDEDVSSD